MQRACDRVTPGTGQPELRRKIIPERTEREEFLDAEPGRDCRADRRSRNFFEGGFGVEELRRSFRERPPLPHFWCQERDKAAPEAPFRPVRPVCRQQGEHRRRNQSPEAPHPDKIHHDKPPAGDERPPHAVKQVSQLQHVVQCVVRHHAVEGGYGEGHQVQIPRQEFRPRREPPAKRFMSGRLNALRAQINARHMKPELCQRERGPPVAAAELEHAGSVLLHPTEETAILPAEKYFKEPLVIPDLGIPPLTRGHAPVCRFTADQDIVVFPLHVYAGGVLKLPAA